MLNYYIKNCIFTTKITKKNFKSFINCFFNLFVNFVVKKLFE